MPSQVANSAIVIGGGIAGCSSAYALAQRGWQVTLIERRATLAAQASGNPIGVLYPRLTGSQNSLSDLAIASFKHSLNLLKNLKLAEGDYQACGLLQLSFNARELARHQAVAALDTVTINNQPIAQLLNQDEASQIAGIALNHGGLYIKSAGWVRPAVLCKALTQHANIQILYESNAVQLSYFKDKTQAYWQVATTEKIIATAPVVIIANASDALQFAQTQHLGLQPVRGQTTDLVVTKTSKALQAIVCAESYICPAINGVHHLGATFSSDDDDANLREKDHLQNIAALSDISASFAQKIDASTLTGRVAWRSSTKDYHPLVGPILEATQLQQSSPRYNAVPASLPWLSGLYVNVGYGAKGLITAPYCAELLANYLASDLLANDLDSRDKDKARNSLNMLNPNRFLLQQMGLKQLAKTALM